MFEFIIHERNKWEKNIIRKKKKISRREKKEVK